MCQNCHPHYRVTWGRLQPVCLFLMGLWVVCSAVPALAHKVMIFAWIEGDTVYTQSKFSGGRKVKNSVVVVYDKEGNELLKGKTDEKGEFSFKVPKKTDLKIVLRASMGHAAEWNIPAEKIGATVDASWSSASEVGVNAANEEAVRLSADVRASRELPVPTSSGLSRKDVQDLVDKSLDKKLAPIITMLSDSLDCGPRLTEVIGGIGYILGLMGVALYFASRRQKK